MTAKIIRRVPSELPVVARNEALKLLIQKSQITEKSLQVLVDRVQDDDVKTSEVVAIFKAAVNAEIAFAGIDVKYMKAMTTETHQHLTVIFSKTEQEIEKMTPEERCLYESLRVKAAQEIGAPRE